MPSTAGSAPHRCSQAALARTLNVSRQAINDLVRRNVIPIGSDGLIDVELAAVAIANRVRPSGKTGTGPSTQVPAALSQPPPSTPPADVQMSYHVAKTLRETAEARLAQLKLAEMQGRLIAVDQIEPKWRAAVIAAREGLQREVRSLAAALDGITDRRQREEIITRRTDTFLRRLSSWRQGDVELAEPDEATS